ncbi:hypothetical protein CMUS01_02514 [Colletotrichum musicola]|uniref:Uncharacterized protein n=1 Tax=Colletotrichum musicola TaxID=2175873 RepID=A0A8H6NV35_9PEZI|nr:hypothetical protein CMUS01_02514 [Colletotrichum musicola]
MPGEDSQNVASTKYKLTKIQTLLDKKLDSSEHINEWHAKAEKTFVARHRINQPTWMDTLVGQSLPGGDEKHEGQHRERTLKMGLHAYCSGPRPPSGDFDKRPKYDKTWYGLVSQNNMGLRKANTSEKIEVFPLCIFLN